ncbi:MAG: FapA family protein [Sterolibacterium sp.]|nr:FapA family protein [Sterolibacterium sp.]
MESGQQRGTGLTFRLDPEAKALVATVTPDVAAQPIDEAWLREHLAKLGYGTLSYLPSAVTVLLAKYNTGVACVLKLADCVDGSFHVAIAANELEAYLHLQPAQGGIPVTLGAVLSALADKGIKDGILTDIVEGAINAGFADGVIVARGRPAIHGSDGRFESLLPEVRSRTPKVDEFGRIDYHDLGEIMVVHSSDRLMLRHPPTEGGDGLSLLGKVVPAKPGKEVMYATNLTGTTFAPDDPNLLQAAISGQPVIVNGGMIVEPIFKVRQVGTASGNIDFDGSVVISDDVNAGMTVRASGDIEIGGVAEMAMLEAGGSIVIKGGAIGNLGPKSGGECHIRCGGCFNAAYVQQARVDAGDSIFIDDVAMQSELSAHNHIHVGIERRGQIIGGSAQAMLSITAKVIGSPNHVRTRLEIGVNPLMHKQLLSLTKDRDTKETQLLEVSKLLDLARKNPGKLPPEMIGKARATADSLSADIAKLREEQDLLTKKIELTQQSRVVVQQTIYEGVEVLMGNQCYRAVGEKGPGAIGLGDSGLELLPLEEQALGS